MKKIYNILLILACMWCVSSCDDGSLSHDDVRIPDPVADTDEDDGIASEPTTTAVIKLQASEEHEHQAIDGFGCAFAGWTNVTYNHMEREAILDDLFGDNGLRLNICRGAIFEHFENPATKEIDFGMDRSYNVPADYPALSASFSNPESRPAGWVPNQMGQMWLTDYMLKKYDNVKFIYSAWTPPTQWKSGSRVNVASFQAYADYMVDFLKAYTEKFKYNIYAVSPTNEPNSGGTGWGGCLWTEAQLGEFCHDYLRPAMNKAGFNDVKIIVGEHAWWNSGRTYVHKILDNQPDIVKDNIIVAGHGYSTADDRIVPYERYEEQGVPVWQTEVCDDRKRDESWSEAMRWANTIHTYFTVANTSSFVWWAGARNCSSTGENLLQFLHDDKPNRGYYKINRYYTLGHFSRYIPEGSRRVDVQAIPSAKDTFPDGLQMSAYVKDDLYTIVLVNNSATQSFTTLLDVEGKEFQNMVAYTSDENVKWFRKKLNPSLSGLRSVTVPKYGVVTITGKLKNTIK